MAMAVWRIPVTLLLRRLRDKAFADRKDNCWRDCVAFRHFLSARMSCSFMLAFQSQYPCQRQKTAWIRKTAKKLAKIDRLNKFTLARVEKMHQNAEDSPARNRN
jgi:hypothetical protein